MHQDPTADEVTEMIHEAQRKAAELLQQGVEDDEDEVLEGEVMGELDA